MLHKFLEILTLPQGLSSSDSPTFVNPICSTQLTTPKIVTASGNLEILPAGNAHIVLQPSGTGKIGVGTGTPENILDIVVPTGNGIRLGQVDTGAGTTVKYLGLNDLGAPGSFAGGCWLSFDGDNIGNYGVTIQTQESGIGNHLVTFKYNGRVGIDTPTPLSRLHLPAGSSVANTAPLQFTSGAVETIKRAGLVEYNNRFILTESDTTNRFIAQAVASTKTIAGAPYTNDGYVTITINGTDIKVMTTA